MLKYKLGTILVNDAGWIILFTQDADGTPTYLVLRAPKGLMSDHLGKTYTISVNDRFDEVGYVPVCNLFQLLEKLP